MADRKISDLTALTAPAAGDYLPIVDISEVAAASKNKRITIEELFRGVPLGTAAAPSIAIEGDENTGIYSPGADQLAVATNGTGRLFVAANGNIGVGTASPVTQLHIQKASDGLAGIQISTSAYGSTATDGLFVGIDNDFGYLYNYENKSLIFGVNAVERMRITPAGLVGVGTSSPSAILHTAQEASTYIRVQRTTSGTEGNLYLGCTSSANQIISEGSSSVAKALRFDVGSTEAMRITSAGLVGIGTSSPSFTAHISGTKNTSQLFIDAPTISAANDYAQLGFGIGGTTFGLVRLGFDNPAGVTNSYLSFYNNSGSSNVERMRIDSSGRVGIGSNAPTQLLTIRGANFTGSSFNGQAIEDPNAERIRVGYKDGSLDTGLVPAQIVQVNASELVIASRDVSTSAIRFHTGTGVPERARIDSSGRLLVGTSTSTNNIRENQTLALVAQGTNTYAGLGATSYAGATQVAAPMIDFNRSRGTTDGVMTSVASGDRLGWLSFRGADGTAFRDAAAIYGEVDGTPSANDMPGRLLFSTTADGAASPTERMRISSAGNMLLGSAAAVYAAGERFSVSPASNTNGVGIGLGNNNNVGIGIYHGYTATGTAIAMQFQDHNATVRGSITVTTSATAYNTSSDYRLKENVAEVTDGITRLQQLKPSRFNFIADPDKTVDGFIAHEVQDIVPEAITGEKDAVDDDGNPVYQGIDQSKLVPLLTAALQEAIGEIESLKARVAALEAQ